MMALFSMRMQVIKRSAGRSVIAAAAYRSAEKMHDDRQNMVHDFSRRKDVERTELIFPDNAPEWVQGITREEFWNRVDAGEKRKDAQTARELRIMIPRELPSAERIAIVRDYVIRCFVSRGMIADVAWHNKPASDGLDQCHAHVMLTMRRAVEGGGFGQKVRHEFIPDPAGRTHPDGRPVMVESNTVSWNSAEYYERCREDWENTANAALARIGSAERIDRRSLLERGLARMPEPALRLAFHLQELHGVMRERFGQFQFAKHYQEVEKRAKAAFRLDTDPVAELKARAEARAAAPRRIEPPAQRWQRFHNWIDRQLGRLALAPPAPERGQQRQPERSRPPRSSPDFDMER